MSRPAGELWRLLREEASNGSSDPVLAPLLRHVILQQEGLGEAVCTRVARAFGTSLVPETSLRAMMVEVVRNHGLEKSFAADLHAIRSRDQAADGLPSLVALLQGVSRTGGIPNRSLPLERRRVHTSAVPTWPHIRRGRNGFPSGGAPCRWCGLGSRNGDRDR